MHGGIHAYPHQTQRRRSGGRPLVGGLGAVTAIGENAVDTSAPESAEVAERVQPRVAELAREAQEAEAIEFAGALHEDRVTDYALAVYDNEVKRQEAERIAAAAAAPPRRSRSQYVLRRRWWWRCRWPPRLDPGL